MQCHQCTNLALYLIGKEKIPLCLDCYYKISQIHQRELENQERMLNFLGDEIAGVVGVPSVVPRFPPRPSPIHIGAVRLHNISVSNSVVGTINTGSIGSVDQSISALTQLGEPNLASAVKALTEAILQSGDLSQNQKNELIETISVVAREAATPADSRHNTVALSLLDKASKITSIASDVAGLCQKFWPVLIAVFAAGN